MNIRRSLATVGAAGALVTGSLFVAAPAQAQPLVTGGLVNVTLNDVTILENVGVGVAANVQANVCGVQVGAQVLTILSGLAQDQDVECSNEAGDQTVTIEQA